MEGTDDFAPGIPACSEGRELCVVPCGLVGDPPFFQLLIPPLPVCCSADTDMSSPYGGMSIGVHNYHLYSLSAAIFCFVRFNQPTAWYIISSLTIQKSNELLS